MGRPNKIAYIDEFGNTSLNFGKPNISSHYIITAIIVDFDKIAFIEEDVKRIRDKYFPTSEIKSRSVGKNDKKRIQILNEISSLDIQIASLIVDKKRLYSNGFKYKKSFYKYLHNKLEKELLLAFPALQLVSDRFGDEEFMKSFIRYLDKKYPADLLKYATYQFVSSKGSLLTQIADFVAGSIARKYDDTVKSIHGKDYIKLLKNRLTHFVVWPREFIPYFYSPDRIYNTKHDETIATYSFKLACEFVGANSLSNDLIIQDQVNCLKYLLFYFENIDSEEYVYSPEIIRHICSNERKIKPRHFQTKVIGQLRDKGVLIASSSKGYKIPSSIDDCYSFLNKSNSTIDPYLKRIEIFREKILLLTSNDIDILEPEQYRRLRAAITTE